MRSGKLLFVFSSILLAGVMLSLLGCSDDKTSTGTGADDPKAAVVQDRVNGFLDSTLVVSSNALRMVLLANDNPDEQWPPSYGSINPDSIKSDNGWLVIIGDRLQTSATFKYRDSIQFTRGGVTQTRPKGAQTMTIRHHWQYADNDTTGEFKKYAVDGTHHFTGLTYSTTTANDTTFFAVDTRETVSGVSVRSSISIQATISNMTFSRARNGWNHGCPSSGTLQVNVNLSHQVGNGASTTSAWTITGSITDGILNATLTSGNVTKVSTTNLCNR